MEEQSRVRFLSGPLMEKTINLQKSEIIIGRDEQNDIFVPDPKVSRRHARIYRRGETWMIENLSRSSFISINHEWIQQKVLQNNTVVSLGDTTSFIFIIQPAVPAPANMPARLEPTLGLTPSPRSHTEPIFLQPNIPSNISPTGTVIVQSGLPSLSISSNVNNNVQRYLLKQPTNNIGRDPDNEIVLAEKIISGRHMQIVREGSHLFLVHPSPAREKTLNGLWYQGKLIRGDQSFRQQLMHGDIFRVGSEYGDSLVTFTYDDGSGASTEKLPEMPPIALTGGRLTIGRASDNTVVLNNLQVSAHHAVLEKAEKGYRIRDNNSSNHVYVNGEIATDQVLRTGDEIHIGPFRFTYTGTELKPYDESAHIRIDAHGLKKFGDKQKVLLNDITLTIPPRKFVALVGGSGAGKSTLMDALNGLRPAQAGTVLYNGVDYYRNLAAFNTQLGYVPQENIVHRDLTVKRALYYAARLRLSRDLTKEQIQWRIDEVLEDVEMTDRRDLLINKLSGGQLKRVSIALELLSNPGVFFLDEPTSGLDPGLDRKMMALLRRLADRGHTIILVTHATNNINVCDHVCFLAKGGRLAYFGPPSQAQEYFDKSDFAEIYSSLEPPKDQPGTADQIAEEAEARFRASADYQQYVAAPSMTKPAEQGQSSSRKKKPFIGERNRQQSRRGRGWLQFFLLSTRYMELLKNDRGSLLMLLLQAPIIAIILLLCVRSQVGQAIFDPNNVVQCQTRALDPDTGKVEATMPQAATQGTLSSCNDVITFLNNAQKAAPDANVQKFNQAHPTQGNATQNDPNAQKDLQKAQQADQQNQEAKDLIKKRGGVNQALQDFITPGFGANAQKILFILAFANFLFSGISGIREFVKEDAIYRRERAVNLGIAPYMFSKIVVLGVLCLYRCAAMMLVIEIGEPLQNGPGVFLPSMLEMYITLCLTSLAGLLTGLTISAMAANSDRAVTFLPLVLLPQVIFGGSIIPQKVLLSQALSVFFPVRWALVALGSSFGLHSNVLGNDHLWGNDDAYHSTLFSIYSHADAMQRLELAWGAMVATIVVFIILIAVFLKRKDAKV